MGEQTTSGLNPIYNHLLSLIEECRQKDAPAYMVDGINKAIQLIEERDLFCEEMSTKPSEALQYIASATRSHPWKKLSDHGHTGMCLDPAMLTGALEGQFLRTLVSMSKAKRVLELGMYTGYSALACAEILPDNGEVVTCEINPYLENMAKGLFENSPHGRKISIRIGLAKDTLLQLAQEKQGFDIVFIDSDKQGYKEYYQIIMDSGLLNSGGTIIFDNAFFYGQTYDKDCSPEKYPKGWGVHNCNTFVAADTRVEQVKISDILNRRARNFLVHQKTIVMGAQKNRFIEILSIQILVPIRDGVLIVRRKEDM